jgi:uncharacterized protein (TIGR03032 family)
MSDNTPDTTQPAQQVVDFSSVHTQSMPQILRSGGFSVLVTTYQAGKLIVLRESEGKLNTHFRMYRKPMGLAGGYDRFALGSTNEIHEYRNMPVLGKRLDPPEKHDSVFIPRSRQITGDIDIHEMAYDRSKVLWFVNTRFSCLCTRDFEHSFVPRWRPPFVTGYAPEDRCHLNGLDTRDGVPRYVTMLGKTDTRGGWRENKRDGGLLMDIKDNRIICEGLSMPHSPRWYKNQLWVLESGYGALAKVNEQTGEVTRVCELPGFTRGIDFYGDLAFIGLSQVRESAVFSGLPLTERTEERQCGVWVVNINTGETLGFLRFEGSVQEIFAVQIIPGARFPDVIEDANPLLLSSYALPDEALKEVDYEAIERARREDEEKLRQKQQEQAEKETVEKP